MATGFFQLGVPRLAPAELVHHLKEGHGHGHGGGHGHGAQAVIHKAAEYAKKRANTVLSDSSHSVPLTMETKASK